MKSAVLILAFFWTILPNVFGQPCTSSLLFDDVSIGVDLPASNQYYSGSNGGYTWECWFKLNEPFNGQSRPLIDAIDAVTFEDMWLGFGWQGGFFNESDTRLVFKVDGPNSTVPSAPNCSYEPAGGFQLNTWYHAAGVMNYSSQTAKLYVNGQLVDTKIITTPPITRIISTHLSYNYPGGPLSLNGNMDEVRIWDRALTATEIAVNYNQCLAGTEQNLLLYYRCSENNGILISDATANNLDGLFSAGIGWSVEAPLITGVACTGPCNVEICGNGIDDNADGIIDENCGCPTLSVSNDTTVCQDASVQLNASSGFTTYTWTPAIGLSDSSIQNPVATPAVSTNYTVTAESWGPNLVLNPDFHLGAFAVATDYVNSSTSFPCNSHIGPMFFNNTTTSTFPDHSSGADNIYLSIDGCYNPIALWKQQISTEQNTEYYFSFWATRAAVAQPIFEIHIIGNITGDQIVSTQTGIPSLNGYWGWDEYAAPIWNSGANTTVVIKVVNLEPNGTGVDFGIDDLLFRKRCQSTETVFVQVNASGPNVDLGGDIGSCTPEPHVFNAGTGFQSYLWNDGSTNQSLTVLNAGTYWVSVMDACGQTQSDTVNTYIFPIVELGLEEDYSICLGEDTQLNTGTNAFTNYSWTGAEMSCDDCASPVVSPQVSGTYYVAAFTLNGCEVQDSIHILVKDDAPTDVELTITEGDCFKGGKLVIGDVTGGTNQVEFDFASHGFSMERVYDNVPNGNYLLTIRNGADGCPFETFVQLYGEEKTIYIPNAFTPGDADVYNNEWGMKGDCVSAIACRIFNRWGEEIARIDDLDETWDGIVDGFLVQDGIYSYVVEVTYTSNFKELKSGFIAVIR